MLGGVLRNDLNCLFSQVEEIRKKKALAEQEYRNSMPASSYQQQKLRVCEVCSAYLGIHDNDRRLADHFGGKLHLGFIKIREKLAALLVRIIFTLRVIFNSELQHDFHKTSYSSRTLTSVRRNEEKPDCVRMEAAEAADLAALGA